MAAYAAMADASDATDATESAADAAAAIHVPAQHVHFAVYAVVLLPAG
jgi:hypothetical protein